MKRPQIGDAPPIRSLSDTGRLLRTMRADNLLSQSFFAAPFGRPTPPAAPVQPGPPMMQGLPLVPMQPLSPSSPSTPALPWQTAGPRPAGQPRQPGPPASPAMPAAPTQRGLAHESNETQAADDVNAASGRVEPSFGSNDEVTGDGIQSDSPHTAPRAASSSVGPRGGARPSELGLRALDIARGSVGVRESPLGSNRGPEVDRFTGGRAEPWCAHFVSWCVERAGASPFGHLSSVSSLRSWAQRNGRYAPVSQRAPAPGDILTMPRYDKTGQLVGGHTGFIEAVSQDGSSIETVEGNVSDGVHRRRRSTSEIDGSIRL